MSSLTWVGSPRLYWSLTVYFYRVISLFKIRWEFSLNRSFPAACHEFFHSLTFHHHLLNVFDYDWSLRHLFFRFCFCFIAERGVRLCETAEGAERRRAALDAVDVEPRAAPREPRETVSHPRRPLQVHLYPVLPSFTLGWVGFSVAGSRLHRINQ